MVKLVDILRETRQEQINEFDAKKALAAGALALGLAGTPAAAQATKEPLPATQTQQKQDTTATGFGIGKSPDEAMAFKIAKIRATADLMQKLGKTHITAGVEVVNQKLFQTKNGYESEVTVKFNQ